MDLQFKSFTDEDTAQAIAIWNQVVTDGVAFPQTETLTLETGKAFFKAQTYTGVAYQADTGQIVGLYILHPNNVGRCGHICNTSYAVDSHFRGQHIGEKLVRHSMVTAKNLRFRILQFNAVVKSNQAALALYQKLGFHQLGTIPAGFLNKNNEYEDIISHYYDLTKLPD